MSRMSIIPTRPIHSRRPANSVRTLCLAACAIAAMMCGGLAQAQQANPFQVIKTINVNINPFEATLSPDGKTVWVANSGTLTNNSNKVTLIDVATLTEEPNKITVQEFPEDIAFGRLGQRAFVTNSSSSSLSVINVNTKQVEQTVNLSTVPLNFPFGVAVGLLNQQIFVTTQGDFNLVPVLNNGLTGVSLKTTIPIPGLSGRPAVVPVNISNPGLIGNILIPVAPTGASPELDIVNPLTDVVSHTVVLQGNTGAAPQAAAVSPDGRFAYVTLFDFSGGPGGVWVIDLKALSTVTVINTGDPGTFGVSVTPNGRYVFATNFLKDNVVVINPATNQIIATIPVGAQPNAIAFTNTSSEAFVTNQDDTTVSVIAIPIN